MEKLTKSGKNKLALLMVLAVLLQLVFTTLESIQFALHTEQAVSQDHHHDLANDNSADAMTTVGVTFVEDQDPHAIEDCDNCHDCHGSHFALFLQIDADNLGPLSGFSVGYLSALFSTPSESLYRPPIV